MCCSLQENEKTKDILIEQRFHRTIIGTKGGKIREIREKYPEVQISFPDAGKMSDIVNLRGPREDVDGVYTLLKKLSSELVILVGSVEQFCSFRAAKVCYKLNSLFFCCHSVGKSLLKVKSFVMYKKVIVTVTCMKDQMLNH